MKECILSFFNWCLLNERVCPFILWLPVVLFKSNYCRFQKNFTEYVSLQHSPKNSFLLQKDQVQLLAFPQDFFTICLVQKFIGLSYPLKLFACNPIAISQRRGGKYHFQETVLHVFQAFNFVFFIHIIKPSSWCASSYKFLCS